MSYTDKLNQIDLLQATIQKHGLLSPELLNKINYKFRLEWNYTSNSMEGNSLTKRETRTVMVGLVDVNDKPIKDVMEIRQHDAVISTIMKMGKGELNISEKRVREIHKGIMYEEDPEKLKYVGEWKNTDNYLYNSAGERFDFVSHTEVKERIHLLINWLNTEKEKIAQGKKEATHPAILAFNFHLDYLTIHPFYDGNGRTARILSNLILIAYGYPPLYIKEEEKQKYYQYLTDIQSYGGSPDLFYDFMCGLLLRSMKMIVDAIEGRSIEDQDDIDKEIALFKLSLDKKNERKEIRSLDNISKIIEKSAVPLFQKFLTKLSQFDELFHTGETRIIYNTDQQSGGYNIDNRRLGYAISTVQFPVALTNWIIIAQTSNRIVTSMGIEYFFKGYKLSTPYDLPVFLYFRFDEYTYSLLSKEYDNSEHLYLEKNYDYILDENDIYDIVNEITKGVFSKIKNIQLM
jgi:Fic family protein